MNFRDHYFEAIGTRDTWNCEDLYKNAEEIRRFEIDLYWKRATYFWAFQLLAFSALGLLANGARLQHSQFLTIPASIGVVTALAGFFTARGSKFWQENWEAHVDLLEIELKRKLTQVLICKKGLPRFSVTRGNEVLLILFAFGWSFVLVVGAFPALFIALVRLAPVDRGILVLEAVLLACVFLWLESAPVPSVGQMISNGQDEWRDFSSMDGSFPAIIWRDPIAAKGLREQRSERQQ